MRTKIFCVFLVFALLLSACTQSKAATWQEKYDLGIRYLSEGNYKEAVLAFNAAIEIDPKLADAYIGLADAYAAQGDMEQARQVLENALAVVTDSIVIQNRLDGLVESAAPSSALRPTPGTTVEPTADPTSAPSIAPTAVPGENIQERMPRQISDYSPDGALVHYSVFDCDELGRTRRQSDYSPEGVLEWCSVYYYDELGWEIRSELYKYGGELISYDEITYDEQYLTKKFQTYGADGTPSGYSTYVFNDAGQMTESHSYYPGGTEYHSIFVYSYNELGLPVKEEGYSEDGRLEWYSTYEYEGANFLTKMTHYDQDGIVTGYSLYDYS